MPRPAVVARCSFVALALTTAAAHAEQFVLVSSWLSQDVRRYTLSGTFVDTFIAAGSGGLGLPDGMTVGPDGDVYLSDANNARILRYNGSTGAFKSVFATGTLTRAGYSQFGPDGNLYVCSAGGDGAVHRFSPTGTPLGVFVGGDGSIAFPAGLAWQGNTLFVSAFQGARVFRYDATTGIPQGNIAVAVNSPLYARVDPNGDLYVSEFGTNRIVRYNTTTNRVVGRYGNLSPTGVTPINGPVGQLLLPNGELLVTSWKDGRVVRMDPTTGNLLGNFATNYPQANDIVLTPNIPAPTEASLLAITAMTAARRRR